MNLTYLEKDINISNFSNFRTKSFTKYFYEIKNEDDILKLSEIYDFSLKNNLKLLIISWWTNICFAFDNFYWIIIKNSLKLFDYDINNHLLRLWSWEYISDISRKLEDSYSQNIWHRFIWLPWTIAWAISWNAWCFGLEAESNFLEASLYNLETWFIEKKSKLDMKFGYRDSFLKYNKKYFIIDSIFDLSHIVEKYSSNVDNIKFREDYQEKWNNCWSFFKNPSKENSAWFLIESVWLKWFKLWKAYFSNIHANFLSLEDNWNFLDVLRLKDLAIKLVKEKYSIELIPEVEIIYN